MKTVDLPAGRLAYRDEGQGPVLLLLHGTLINGDTWREVTRHLSPRYRCIAPDLPLGAQAIAFPDGADLSAPGIAGLIEQFAVALGLESFTLVGNDTGGAYAQVYAARYPARVSHLVLSSCDALEVFPPKHFAALQASVNIPGYLSVMALLFRSRAFLRSSMALGLLSHRLSGEDIHQRYARHFVASAAVRRNFRQVVRGWSATHTLQAAESLALFNKPVLLIWGADDLTLFPLSLGERLAAVFPNARLEVVPQSMTYVQEDQPAIFARLLEGFVPA